MSNLELVLNMHAEVSTSEISKIQAGRFEENKDITRKGGGAAKRVRLEIEKQTRKAICSLRTLAAQIQYRSKKLVILQFSLPPLELPLTPSPQVPCEFLHYPF